MKVKIGLICLLCTLGGMAATSAAQPVCVPGPNAGKTAVVVDTCHPTKSGFVPVVCASLKRAGFSVVELAKTNTAETVAAHLRRADVVVFQGAAFSRQGGKNVPNNPYVAAARRRGAFEKLVLTEARKQRKPLFGICRGVQEINSFFGGSVRPWPKTVKTPLETPLAHRQKVTGARATHPIAIVPTSRFARVVKRTAWAVNSFHDYAVGRVAPGFRVVATAPDGVVEALEGVDYPAFAVQFHPELRSAKDRESQAIFDHILELVQNR